MDKKTLFVEQKDMQLTFSPQFKKILESYSNKQVNQQTKSKTIQPSVQPIKVTTNVIKDNKNIKTKYVSHMPVQPIPKEYIQKAKDYFHNPHSRYHMNDKRDYCYFVLSINTARRAGDILNLKVRDVLNDDNTIKEHMIIHEQKTGKIAKVKLNQNAKEALAEYLNSKKQINMDDYLFQNYKTGNKLTVDGARKIIKRMVKAIGLDKTGMSFGTHSLRKTWAKTTIDNNPNNSKIEIAVSQALNHSSVASTRHYIGRTQEEMDMLFENNLL